MRVPYRRTFVACFALLLIFYGSLYALVGAVFVRVVGKLSVPAKTGISLDPPGKLGHKRENILQQQAFQAISSNAGIGASQHRENAHKVFLGKEVLASDDAVKPPSTLAGNNVPATRSSSPPDGGPFRGSWNRTPLHRPERYEQHCNENCCMYGPGLKGLSLPVQHFWVSCRAEPSSSLVASDAVQVDVASDACKGKCRVEVSKGLGREFLVMYYARKSGQYAVQARSPAGSGPVVSFYITSDRTIAPLDWDTFVSRYSPSPKLLELALNYYAPWPPGSMSREMMEKPVRPTRQPPIEFVIINNTLYSNIVFPYKNRWYNIYYSVFLTSLLRKVKIPNVRFRMSLEDHARVLKGDGAFNFAPCKSMQHHEDVLIPNAHMIKAWLKGEHIRTSVQDLPWADRLAKIYFRGWNTGPDLGKSRMQAALVASARQDIFDVKVKLKFPVSAQAEKTLQEAKAIFVLRVKEAADRDYRYLLNLDGWVAAYRLSRLLSTGNTVLKQESPWVEYWYPLMKPWEHVVPVENDFSDLLERGEWISSHTEEAEAIGRNGHAFFLEHLQLEDVYGYMAALLRHLALAQNFEHTVPPDMVRVEDPGGEVYE